MNKTLHLVCPFHTVPSLAASHCAFTGKALRFPKMMQPHGYRVVEYSNGQSESLAEEKVVMLTEAELETMTGKKDKTAFHGSTATIGSLWWNEFDRRLRLALKERVQPNDFICHPFGRAHAGLVRDFPQAHHVETGIGYPDQSFGAFRIYESYAWMHYHQGQHLNFDPWGRVVFRDNLPVVGRSGSDYEWVVPNYFDLYDWTPRTESGKYLLYFGRICPEKGLSVIQEIAKRIDEKIVVAGQGDITPWAGKNIEYIGPVTGKARDKLLGEAKAILVPTRFTEPFGGVAVEAMLCGTPAITSDFGAFTETVQRGENGWRCHTLRDWLNAIASAPDFDRKKIALHARRRYSLEYCGACYNGIFNQIADLECPPGCDPSKTGWYANT